ncbi:MAG: hypothetical protein J5733_01875 [Bacteroidaceae bacterium]|nr:hypothetical protein [Bacteroidaceae bacterium]
MAVKKIVGWGKCSSKETPVSGSAVTYNDIKEGSASLSVEEGNIDEALIEGGEAEATKSQPDKYILEYDRRIADAAQVTPGFVENAGNVEILPPANGAVGIKLTSVCRKITLKFDSTDGLVAHYWYKTGGVVDANGNITDVVPVTVGTTFTTVAQPGSNPRIQQYYECIVETPTQSQLADPSLFRLTWDEEPITGKVYYNIVRSGS